MAVTHSTPARNAICAAVLALLNTGSANTAGIFRFRTSANAVVSANPFANPAFGSPTAGQAAANPLTADTNAVGGTIARATLEDRDRVAHITLDDIRATSGGDMQGNTLVVAAGATVQILSLNYIAPQ